MNEGSDDIAFFEQLNLILISYDALLSMLNICIIDKLKKDIFFNL